MIIYIERDCNQYLSRINTCKIYVICPVDSNFIFSGIVKYLCIGKVVEMRYYNSFLFVTSIMECIFSSYYQQNSLRTCDIFNVFLSNQNVRVTLK